MPKYRISEVKAEDIGKEQAEMLNALLTNLKKQGLSADLAEKMALNMAGAASSWADGCKGMENPADLVSNPTRVVTPR